MVDTRQGYLSRTGLYKALALVAFAQQGKTVSEKLIQNFTGEGMYFAKGFLKTDFNRTQDICLKLGFINCIHSFHLHFAII